MIIDQVRIKAEAGEETKTLQEWEGMALPRRIQLIRGGAVEFLSGGEAVSIDVALKAIKKARLQAA